MGPKLLLITKGKSHKPLHMTRKLFAGLRTPTCCQPSLAKAELLVSWLSAATLYAKQTQTNI